MYIAFFKIRWNDIFITASNVQRQCKTHARPVVLQKTYQWASLLWRLGCRFYEHERILRQTAENSQQSWIGSIQEVSISLTSHWDLLRSYPITVFLYILQHLHFPICRSYIMTGNIPTQGCAHSLLLHIIETTWYVVGFRSDHFVYWSDPHIAGLGDISELKILRLYLVSHRRGLQECSCGRQGPPYLRQKTKNIL